MLALIRGLLKSLFASRTALVAENLALRHQLGILGRSIKLPRLRPVLCAPNTIACWSHSLRRSWPPHLQGHAVAVFRRSTNRTAATEQLRPATAPLEEWPTAL